MNRSQLILALAACALVGACASDTTVKTGKVVVTLGVATPDPDDNCGFGEGSCGEGLHVDFDEGEEGEAFAQRDERYAHGEEQADHGDCDKGSHGASAKGD